MRGKRRRPAFDQEMGGRYNAQHTAYRGMVAYRIEITEGNEAVLSTPTGTAPLGLVPASVNFTGMLGVHLQATVEHLPNLRRLFRSRYGRQRYTRANFVVFYRGRQLTEFTLTP